MLIEGPFVTTAAAFAAALGHLNISAVLALAFIGDLVSDIAFYVIGFWGRAAVVERYGKWVGATKEQLLGVEEHFQKHGVKELVAMKFLPMLSTIGLATAGALRMPFRKFLITVTLVIIPRTLFFGAIGFYFGHIYDQIARYLQNAQIAFLVVAAAGIVAYFAYRRITAYIRKRSNI